MLWKKKIFPLSNINMTWRTNCVACIKNSSIILEKKTNRTKQNWVYGQNKRRLKVDEMKSCVEKLHFIFCFHRRFKKITLAEGKTFLSVRTFTPFNYSWSSHLLSFLLYLWHSELIRIKLHQNLLCVRLNKCVELMLPDLFL